MRALILGFLMLSIPVARADVADDSDPPSDDSAADDSADDSGDDADDETGCREKAAGTTAASLALGGALLLGLRRR